MAWHIHTCAQHAVFDVVFHVVFDVRVLDLNLSNIIADVRQFGSHHFNFIQFILIQEKGKNCILKEKNKQFFLNTKSEIVSTRNHKKKFLVNNDNNGRNACIV
jgi:hypothetical protein